jgi:hypothetical protein
MRLRRRREAEAPAEAEGPGSGTATTATRRDAALADSEGRTGPVARTGSEGRAAPAVAGEAPARGEEAPLRRRRGATGRTQDAAGATVGAIGAGVLALARLVMLVAGLIALLIALAIVLRDVDANASNSIVKGIHEGANFFAGSFTGLIAFSGHPKRAITVDWGIALLAYLLVGALIARLIAGIGRGGVRFERRHRAIPTH